MLEFILYSSIFEILLAIPFIINVLTISILECKSSTEFNKTIKNDTDITTKIKLTIQFLILAFTTILMVIFFSQYILTFLLLFIMFISLIKSIVNIYTNENTYTLDNKYYNVFATIIFIVFLAPRTIPLYTAAFQHTTIFTKNILLILFINIKLILFVFLLLINISVLISNITELLTDKQKKFLSKFLSLNCKSCNTIQYNFALYKKKTNKKYLIIDTIIYIFLTPLTLVLNSLLALSLKLFFNFKSIVKFIVTKAIEYTKNKNLLTRRITYISIIISLSISYIIIVTNDKLFIETTQKLFDYFSTVILIPLIYDSIKNK